MKLYNYKIKKEFVKEIEDNKINGPEKLYQIARPLIDFDCDKEQLIVLFLNGMNQITGFHIVSVGGLNQSVIHPREVFRPAIINASAAIILVHNHPSGNWRPSESDIGVTRKIKESGELLGIPLLDHLIITENAYYSMKKENLI